MHPPQPGPPSPRQGLTLLLALGALWGTAAGVLLGLFLKTVQLQTGSLVYTLLLNVDFLPLAAWLGLSSLPELLEFALHLAVSIGIGMLFALGTARRHWRPWPAGLLLGLAAAPVYIPLSLLSPRVPRLDDGEAWAWWLAAHLLYGAALAGCGQLQRRLRR